MNEVVMDPLMLSVNLSHDANLIRKGRSFKAIMYGDGIHEFLPWLLSLLVLEQ